MLKRITTPKSKLVTSSKRGLFVTARTRTFLKKHPQILGLIRRAIKEKFDNTKSVSQLKKRKAVFKYDHTGTWKGMENYGTYSVQIGSKKWFVKHEVGGVEHLATLIERFNATRKMIKGMQGKVHGFNVRLIEPELIYAQSHTPLGEVFLATKFFEEHRVKLVSDLFAEAGLVSKFSKIRLVIPQYDKEARELALKLGVATARIESEMGAQVKTGEDRRPNLFYEHKTNTIWIFDMGGSTKMI
ncbi:MAG: hypothetical protein WCW44_05480 [archaeon]|jgi:hypothetical protein